ncbi:MAG: histidine phosphatase family protein [Victivallales bacterium]|nr:histidine phosphatase family protein [Victivallales bacterium]
MSTIPEPRQFYLIRHAESLGNIAMSGGGDPCLSPLGRAQAAHCAEVLAELIGDLKTVAISSPFERCLDTSEIIISQLENCEGVGIEPALSESLGAYNLPMGYKPAALDEKADQHSLAIGEYDHKQWWSMEVETEQSVSVRMSMLRNRLLGTEYDSEVVICVGHWPTIAALAIAMIPDIDMRKVENAAITKITHDETFTLELLNAHVYRTN